MTRAIGILMFLALVLAAAILAAIDTGAPWWYGPAAMCGAAALGGYCAIMLSLLL